MIWPPPCNSKAMLGTVFETMCEAAISSLDGSPSTATPLQRSVKHSSTAPSAHCRDLLAYVAHICPGAVPSAQALAPETASARAHRGPSSYGGRPLVASIRAVLGSGLWPRRQHSSSLSASGQVFLGDLFWHRTRGLAIRTSSAGR